MYEKYSTWGSLEANTGYTALRFASCCISLATSSCYYCCISLATSSCYYCCISLATSSCYYCCISLATSSCYYCCISLATSSCYYCCISLATSSCYYCCISLATSSCYYCCISLATSSCYYCCISHMTAWLPPVLFTMKFFFLGGVGGGLHLFTSWLFRIRLELLTSLLEYLEQNHAICRLSYDP